MPPLIRGPRGKRWCITWNNYSEEALEELKVRLTPLIDYGILGREVGAGGTRHIQGYCEFKQRYRLSQLKNSICADAHFELARGTGQQNCSYCSKSDQEPWCYGELGRYNRGSETPRDRPVRDELATRFSELISSDGASGARTFACEYPGVWYFSGSTLLRNYGILQDARDRPNIKVTWIYGPPGVGKSRKAHEELPQAYLKDGRTKWWNGYMYEVSVIIDDFAPRGIDITHLLVWFDRYKCRVETKGGYMPLWAETFYVTSNFHPCDVYKGEDGAEHPQLPALLRRISIIHMV